MADKEKQSIIIKTEMRMAQFTKTQLVHISFIDSFNFGAQKNSIKKKA